MSLKLLKEIKVEVPMPASTWMLSGAVAGGISLEYSQAGGLHMSVTVIKKDDQCFITSTV